jgi:hypothetical protein
MAESTMQQGYSSSLAFRLVLVTALGDAAAQRRLQGWTNGKTSDAECLAALVPLATSVQLERVSTSAGSGQ